MKLKDFSKLYFALLILHIATLYRGDQGEMLYLFSKPLLMFSLLAFFVHRLGVVQLRAKTFFILALVFSLLGDILLMFGNEERYFMAGVGAFLLAQLSYTSFFLANSKGFNWRSLFMGLPLVAIGFYVLNGLLFLPEALVLPVNVYGLALGTMVVSAFNYGTRQGRRAVFINLGAISFLASDILLAYGKFSSDLPFEAKYVHIIVMLTYAIAQFLLATSVIAVAENKHYQDQSGSTS